MRATYHLWSLFRSHRIVIYLMMISPWVTLDLYALTDSSIEYNRDIRPILAENCFSCHGQDANRRQADLRLDMRQVALQKGAISPGKVKDSRLVTRIESTDPSSIMPPPNSNRRLSKEQKQQLKNWIREGALYEQHWAFLPPVRPEPPEVQTPGWVRVLLDRFVLSKLENEGLTPSPEADRATLIKRVSIDLTGLPPSPEEVLSFIRSKEPDAYEKLVDRMLESPHYGERMALPWLDAARYADSNGFQQDGDTWQWVWRDWVVRALNADMPFDQFTTWQLAGDLLPDATTDQKIASGFNRNHLLNGEGGAIPEEQRFVNLFDRMDTTATTWLALTMACAQCHDHKYDPVTQRDYYRMLDAFNRVPESGTPQRLSSRIRVGAPFIELPTSINKKRITDFESQIRDAERDAEVSVDRIFNKWIVGLSVNENVLEDADLSTTLVALIEKPEAERTPQDKDILDTQLRKHFDDKVRDELTDKLPSVTQLSSLKNQLDQYRRDQIPRVMVMSDARPRETSILERGEYLKPTEKVTFATPEFLPPLPRGAPANRLGLAQWLVSDEHPLTARVQVNRMWQLLFGQGMVKTPEDFGVQSAYPEHRELLDWLAVEFRESGWSMKKMYRMILTSATYMQSSRIREQHIQRDLENRLYARASRFRMPSMMLRDWALASSGLLERQIGGTPVYPYQPEAAWEALAITKERDFTYPVSTGEDLYRRSLYTFWRRTVLPANMFDASNRQACRVRQVTTSTPLHALTTLNDPTWVEAARMLAQQSLQDYRTSDKQIEDIFLRILCRTPTKVDMALLRVAHQKQLEHYTQNVDAAKSLLAVGSAPRNDSLNGTEHAALTVLSLVILNLDEALTRE